MPSPLDSFRDDVLAGHVALITGGGTGICRGIAHAYARFGADVCIVSRKPDVLAKTADELSSATGRKVLAVAADVRDPDAVGNAVKQTLERFGKLDTLVNGAAGNFLAPAAGLSPERHAAAIQAANDVRAQRASWFNQAVVDYNPTTNGLIGAVQLAQKVWNR
jgi:NAD(P)-dependent dehydrogenase (short-subunit alcohol dehydrogenase family)